MKIKITIWNEFWHEKKKPEVKSIYPEGIHKAIGAYLEKFDDFSVRYATIDEPEHGLTDDVLENTDVLIWWGHHLHKEVQDDVVEKVYNRIIRGMGFIPLHSSHHSKVFTRLMGTTCSLRWRCAQEKERIWIIEPSHPICKGLPPYFELAREEMYGERFDIPQPDTLIMAGWFEGGEIFRSGCCFTRGYGRIFYFQPGHETVPTFKDENVLLIIRNAIDWVYQEQRFTGKWTLRCEPLEVLRDPIYT